VDALNTRKTQAVFLAIIDSMTGALKKRLDALCCSAKFVRVFARNLPPDEIRESSRRLVEAYPEDLERDLSDELNSAVL